MVPVHKMVDGGSGGDHHLFLVEMVVRGGNTGTMMPPEEEVAEDLVFVFDSVSDGYIIAAQVAVAGGGSDGAAGTSGSNGGDWQSVLENIRNHKWVMDLVRTKVMVKAVAVAVPVDIEEDLVVAGIDEPPPTPPPSGGGGGGIPCFTSDARVLM